MIKRIIVIGSIIMALVALIVFNKLASKDKAVSTYAEVKRGLFEITVSNSGELLAENSIQIWGPGYGREASGGSGFRGGSGGGQGRSTTLRQEEVKIQDIVSEGTMVREGDYVAQLDKTTYDNALKDAVDYLKTLQDKMQLKLLDTAITLTNLRDDIKNQRYIVEEDGLFLEQAKYEPPAVIRQAENNLNKAQRLLEQKRNNYNLRAAQNLSEIRNQKLIVDQQIRYINELQNFIAKLTITAPAPGMVIYARDRSGPKRTAGTMVDPFDEVIANLPDLSSMLSRIFVNEIEISKVKPGQKVSITIDAFPKKAYTGKVNTIANVGEKLPNSDSKMFEVQIRLDETDPAFRPGMTTDNKIIIRSYNDAIYIPLECVQTGADSIPIVYKKNKTKQIVVLGASNDKNILIEQGLEPGTFVYNITPVDHEKFRIEGKNLIPIIKMRK